MPRHRIILGLLAGVIFTALACQKTTTAPGVSGAASLTIVNAVPASNPIVAVINTGEPIMYFSNAQYIPYGRDVEYSPLPGKDTIYAVQYNSDTLNVGPKTSDLMYYDVDALLNRGIYSLYLCGADTSSPDFLFTTDILPSYSSSDSVMGVRFVNLSTGSNPISINLEGSANGFEVANLPYKGITTFKQYPCNSGVADYIFVIRDAASGDSLTNFDFGGQNNGYGLLDLTNGGALLTFHNITIAIYGSETNMNFPLNTMLIDDY
jgi:hypothetical protein